MTLETYEQITERTKPWHATKGDPKRDRESPCAICGWSARQEIHINPELNGKGPFHEYVAAKQPTARGDE